MSIFQCTQCGCVDNTATSGYWWRVRHEKKSALCSECNPDIGKWHGLFEKRDATTIGELLGSDGFLYPESERANCTRRGITLGPVLPFAGKEPTDG